LEQSFAKNVAAVVSTDYDIDDDGNDGDDDGNDGDDDGNDGDFSEVVHSEEFLTLPVDQVSKLIADDQLAVSSEEQVHRCLLLVTKL